MKAKRKILSGLLCITMLCFMIPAFAKAENKQASGVSEENPAANETTTDTPDDEILNDKIPDEKDPDDQALDNTAPEDESPIYNKSDDEASENTANSVNNETSPKAAIQKTADPDVEIPVEILSSNDLSVINGTLDLTQLTFTDDKASETDSNGNGYICEKDGSDYILTLKNVRIQGDEPVQGSGYPKAALIVPYDAKVTIKTDGTSSILEGGIRTPDNGTGILNLFFSGTGELAINGTIQAGANNDQITVQSSAKIEISERINIGGSGGGVGSHVTVVGAGSTLTVQKATSTAHLSVTEGGTFSAKGTITIRSTEDDQGSISMDGASKIEITATPTLMTQDSNSNNIEGILDSIKQYLPVGYKIGYGTTKGGSTQFYTVLDSEGYVAGTLTLQEPPLGSAEEDTGTPGAADPEESGQTPDSSGEAASDSDDTTDSEATPAWHENRSVPQIKAKDTTPRTGDNEKIIVWVLCLLCSAAVLYLSGWHRIRMNRSIKSRITKKS